jgi:integrase
MIAPSPIASARCTATLTGEVAGVPITRPYPHMLRHTYVTTMLDAGVDLRDVQIAARHADPRTTIGRPSVGGRRAPNAESGWP